MIDKQYVENETRDILSRKGNESEFLATAAKDQIQWLREEPMRWKWYGPYWFNLADVLKRYAPKEFHDFMRAQGSEVEEFDEDIKKRYDFGSDMNNWVAALTYLDVRAESYEINSPTHLVEDEEGNERSYTMDSGFTEYD